MKNFIEKKAILNDEKINELLYYYQQGIEIGKEEAKLTIIDNLMKENMDINLISKITNTSIKKINQLVK